MSCKVVIDAPPHSLKYYNVSPKVETMEEKGVGIYFLIQSNSKIEGCVQALGWGLGQMTNRSIIHTNLHKPSWLVHGWSNFGARIHHKHTHTHNTHHGQDFGKRHHLPPYNILCAWPWGLHPNVILYRDSQVGNFKIPKIWTFATLEANNFLCKPPIEMRFKTKL